MDYNQLTDEIFTTLTDIDSDIPLHYGDLSVLLLNTLTFLKENHNQIKKLKEDVRTLRKVIEPFDRLAKRYVVASPSDWVGYQGAVYVGELRMCEAALRNTDNP
jgi:hypothetical protein